MGENLAIASRFNLINKAFNKVYKVGYPLDRIIFNRNYKFLYCPIPKVATTSISNFIFDLSDIKRDGSLSRYQVVVQEKISFVSISRWEAYGMINSPDYFKFTFVRNPWSRLLSAYINKFVTTNAPITKDVIKWVYLNLEGKEPDLSKSITFRQFVEYVSSNSDSLVDKHWKSQLFLLGGLDYDFIGKIENLEQDFERLCKELSLPKAFMLSHRNKTTYLDKSKHFIENPATLPDMYPAQLKALGLTPKYQLFYTPEIMDKVTQRYRQDIERLGYCDASPI